MNATLFKVFAWALIVNVFGAHATEDAPPSLSLHHESEDVRVRLTTELVATSVCLYIVITFVRNNSNVVFSLPSFHWLASSVQVLQALNNTVDCRYLNSWPSSMTAVQACTSLNDPTHPVPYKCASTGRKLCCTVGNVNTATFGSFGSCSKVVTSGTVPTTPTAKPPTRKPTKVPTKKPSSNMTSNNNISCQWSSSFAGKTAVQACNDFKVTNPLFSVPFLCKDGRKVCCTVSNYASTTTDKFGTCKKVGA